MSADATVAVPAKPPRNMKKLIVFALIGVLLLGGAGVGALLMMKKKAHAEDGEDGGEDAAQVEHHAAKFDPKAAPTFVPLDPFTVNLADKEADRYAQVGLTLEIEDAHVADQLKVFMPAIRNNILLVLASKTANELLSREGKEKLAKDIQREATRAMGMPVADEDDEAAPADDEAADDEGAKKKKKKKKKAAPASPIRKVHFSNFIIQ
jgi:flagellar FliL protein